MPKTRARWLVMLLLAGCGAADLAKPEANGGSGGTSGAAAAGEGGTASQGNGGQGGGSSAAGASGVSGTSGTGGAAASSGTGAFGGDDGGPIGPANPPTTIMTSAGSDCADGPLPIRGTGIARGTLGAGPQLFSERTPLTRPAVLLSDGYIDNNIYGLFAYSGGYVTGGFNGFWHIDVDLNAKLVPYDAWRVNDFAFGDFDGDGDDDVVTTATDRPSGSDGSVTRNETLFWERTADGLEPRFGLSGPREQRNRFAFGDVDEDGDLDLVTYETGGPSMFPNIGGFSFEADLAAGEYEVGVHIEAYAALLRDDDRDGHLDLSVAVHDDAVAGTETTLLWQRGDGTGQFARAKKLELGFHAEKVAFGEVTGDEHLDVVMQAVEGDRYTLQVIRGTGPGELGERETLVEYVNDFQLTDLEGDGTQEILRWSGGLTLLRAAGDTFELTEIDVGSNASTATLVSRASGAEPEVAALFLSWCAESCSSSSCGGGCIFDACRECLTSADCESGECAGYSCQEP